VLLTPSGRPHPSEGDGGQEGQDATLSARTVVYAIRTISAIYNHAIEDGIVQSNPALRPGRFIKTGPRREMVDILTMKEGDHLLKTAEKHFSRTYPLLLTAMRTGMRQGELIALEWGTSTGSGTSSKSAVQRGAGSPDAEVGEDRRVDMSDRLKAVLQQHQTRMKAEALKPGLRSPRRSSRRRR